MLRIDKERSEIDQSTINNVQTWCTHRFFWANFVDVLECYLIKFFKILTLFNFIIFIKIWIMTPNFKFISYLNIYTKTPSTLV